MLVPILTEIKNTKFKPKHKFKVGQIVAKNFDFKSGVAKVVGVNEDTRVVEIQLIETDFMHGQYVTCKENMPGCNRELVLVEDILATIDLIAIREGVFYLFNVTRT